MEPQDISTLNAYIPNWNALDYQTVNHITSALRNLSVELYPKWLERENAKYAKSRKLREDKKSNFDKNIAPRILEWAKNKLKTGYCIKFDGCRDRGYREVSEIDLKSNTVISWQLREVKGGGFVKTGAATTNSIFKIKKVLIVNKWVDIKELI